jgi:hypothetical protein
MNETLNEAIDLLGRLRFETGGALLDQIIALESELRVECQRRTVELQEAGMTELEWAGGAFHDR